MGPLRTGRRLGSTACPTTRCSMRRSTSGRFTASVPTRSKPSSSGLPRLARSKRGGTRIPICPMERCLAIESACSVGPKARSTIESRVATSRQTAKRSRAIRSTPRRSERRRRPSPKAEDRQCPSAQTREACRASQQRASVEASPSYGLRLRTTHRSSTRIELRKCASSTTRRSSRAASCSDHCGRVRLARSSGDTNIRAVVMT